MKSIEVTNEVTITTKEKQIISRLANGEQGDQIRKSLGIPQGTFANILKDMRLKYGCLNTTHLVAYFLREGIIN